jgi:hypothetical protein
MLYISAVDIQFIGIHNGFRGASVGGKTACFGLTKMCPDATILHKNKSYTNHDYKPLKNRAQTFNLRVFALSFPVGLKSDSVF